MKIAFFSVFPLEYGGGLEKYFIEIASQLSKRYREDINEICIINLTDIFYRNLCKILNLTKIVKIKPTFRVNSSYIRRELGENIKWKKVNILNLRSTLNDYDSIYTKNEILELFLLKALKIKDKIKIIAGVHTSPIIPGKKYNVRIRNFLYNSLFYKIISSNVTIFHTINQDNTEFLKKNFKNKNIVKIYNPFDFSYFASKKNTYHYKFKNSGKFTIAWSGRLTEQKGIYDLIEIINQINLQNEQTIEWLIMGDGEMKETLLSNLEGTKNFTYLGHVENNYIPYILSQCDIYLSTSHWEGFPYNLLEAQSMGLPVFCYNIPGCTDIIEDQVNGYLFDNSKEMCDGIIFRLNKKKLPLKDDIIKYIEKKFIQENIYSALFNTFTKN